MEYSIKKEPLCVEETVFDGIVEQPVDLDFSLPDYCEDIKKILKCQICPEIYSKSVSGDRLFVEGNADISLTYLDDEEMSIRCCEHTSPFSVTINLKSAVEDAIILTKTKTEYVNCRAVTPRRLDIHGAFSILATVKRKTEKSVVTDIDASGIEKKKSMIKCSNVVGMGQQYFTVEEMLDWSDNQPDNIRYILKTVTTAQVQDCKTLSNKAIINAQMNVKILYVSDSEDNSVRTYEHNIPISQIVDIEGLEDDCSCNVKLEILNTDVNVRESDNENNNLIAFESKISIAVVAYTEREIGVLTDVYSVDYESEPKYERRTLISKGPRFSDPYTQKGTVELGSGGVSEILDATGDLTSVKTFLKDGKLEFLGKVNVCVLAKDAQGTPIYTERFLEFQYERDLESAGETIFCDDNVSLRSCECKINGPNSVEATLKLQMDALTFFENECMSVADIIIDEEQPREKDKKSALTIYYADDGEELWNIARKYCTSVEKIKLENDINEDILKGRNMIFIPM